VVVQPHVKLAVVAKEQKKEKKKSKESIPACNSAIHPDCVKDAKTASEDSYQWIDNANPDNLTPVKPTKPALAQAEVDEGSVPACNSHTRPGCKDAKTAAPEDIAENLRHPLDSVDIRYPNHDFGYA